MAGPFEGLGELALKLGSSDQVRDCVAEKSSVFAFGLQGAQECVAEEIAASFATTGGDLRELMVHVVTSDSFRVRAGEDTEDEQGVCP